LRKTSLIYSFSPFNLRGLGPLLGGANWSGLHFLNNADSAKIIFMANVTFIESRSTSESNDVFYNSFLQTANNLFELKILVDFGINSPKMV